MPVEHDHATDVTSGNGRGYGKKYKVTVLDLMAAHREGNFKYVQKFLPSLPKASRALYQRRKKAYDDKLAARQKSDANRVTDASGPRFNGDGNPRPAPKAASAPSKGKAKGKAAKAPRGVDLGALAAVGSSVGAPVPVGLANQLAGLEYDQDIRDLGIAQQRHPVQAAQELKDIDHWYDEVLASQETARGRDAAIHDAGVGSVRDATSRIVSSLGGSANEGAGLVGASGLDQVGLLEALGTAQEQYNADMRPLLKAEGAGAQTRQVARNREEAQEIRNKLLGLIGQRGQKRAELQYNIGLQRQDRADRLGQQRFQNALALQEAQMAAESLGLKKLETMAGIQQTRQKAATGWAAMSPADKAAVAGDARMAVFGIDPETREPRTSVAPEYQGKVPEVVRRVADTYRQYGLAPIGNPQVRQHVFATLRSLGITPNQSWLRPPTKRR
jgi:hypothetical protein